MPCTASSSFHTTTQVQAKSANRLFTGDADMSWFDKLKDSFRFQGKLRYPHQILYSSGTKLYICCTHAVEYHNLMEECGLPPTFFMWHKLTTLHIWLLMTRLITEGREGRHVRNRIYVCFQEDMKARCRLFMKEKGLTISTREYNEYNEHFLAALINYDEGLLGDDKALASALWRTLYSTKEVDAEKLELFVGYVRKQAKHLQTQTSEQILLDGFAHFLPPFSDSLDKERWRQFRQELQKGLGLKR